MALNWKRSLGTKRYWDWLKKEAFESLFFCVKISPNVKPFVEIYHVYEIILVKLQILIAEVHNI